MAKISDADTRAHDPRTVKPRGFIPGCDGVPESVGPLCTAIPKQNLIHQARVCTLDLMAEIIRYKGDGRAIDTPTLSRWMKGTRRMPHSSVINVAHALELSPLAVLDLCQTYQRSAPDAMQTRADMQQAVRYLATHAPGDPAPRWIAEPGYVGLKVDAWACLEMDEGPQAYDQLRRDVLAVPGDFRDLTHLTRVAAEYYAEARQHHAEDVMLEGVMQLGKSYTSVASDVPGFWSMVNRMVEDRVTAEVGEWTGGTHL